MVHVYYVIMVIVAAAALSEAQFNLSSIGVWSTDRTYGGIHYDSGRRTVELVTTYGNMRRGSFADARVGLDGGLQLGFTHPLGRSGSLRASVKSGPRPTYNLKYGNGKGTISVGSDGRNHKVGVSIKFRRDLGNPGLKKETFKLLDLSGDGFIDVREWTQRGGSTKNFVALLSVHDTDGNEMISWEEYPDVEIKELESQMRKPKKGGFKKKLKSATEEVETQN